MTEEEAKDKWCPFGKATGHGSNRIGADNQIGTVPCIASQCMAWRWHDPEPNLYARTIDFLANGTLPGIKALE